MKFTYKFFFSITALLTAAFMLFGSFMLFFYFNRMLERETEQGKRENLLFQTIYDMVYQNMEKYGAEFAGIQAGNSATERMTDQNGTECMILETDGTITLEGSLKLPQDEIRSLAEEMIRTMDPGADQVYGVRKVETRYYLLSIITDQATDSADMVYLGILKDLSGIYEERSNMMRQYGIALAGLLVIGGLAAFLLSRYLTRPIEQLNRTAGRIAEGDLEKRAAYQGADEIGELSRSFNRMTDRLVRQMEEKELEAKQKEDFTAAFAHELKTPLTSIIGYADMLNSYELTEQERGEATYYIFSQGKRLESLFHKLLELVGMDRQELEFKKIQTKELEENIRDTMRIPFERKGIRGKINLEKGVILGDRDLLLSLLYNLLDNAVKAVEEGGFILMKGSKLTQGYEIKVVDNGRGIPQEEIARITEAFYMVDKSRSRKEGGAGIGMALCQKIITLHQGELKIDSKLGEGTVMRLYFPGEMQVVKNKSNRGAKGGR